MFVKENMGFWKNYIKQNHNYIGFSDNFMLMMTLGQG